MQKILFVWKPAKIYSDWVETRLIKTNIKLFNRHLANIINKVYIKANLRKLDYCLKNALDNSLCPLGENVVRDLLFLKTDIRKEVLESFDHVHRASDHSRFYKILENELCGKDAVVLLYPDAIGQGYKKAESIIMAKKKKIYVLNGRKRFIELDRKTWLALKSRRIMEKYYVFESIFSMLFLFLIGPYFLYEIITRRRSERFYRKAPLKISGNSFVNDDKEVAPQLIADYWSSRPQTYGLEDGKATYIDDNGKIVVLELGNKEFFNKVDETCYSWNKPLHLTTDGEFIPFTRIFDYNACKGRPVLEIGCGMGTMAMNWAKYGAKIHAVDLNHVAVKQTRERFKIYNLKGSIQQADARRLPFPDNYFDYAYSWGVLHHSPHIEKSMEEIFRVLTPGGKVGIMLYYRKSFLFRYMVKYTEGYLHYENRFLTLLELASRYGDGYMEEGNPYTYPVTQEEVSRIIMPQFKNIKIRIFGTDIPWMLSFLCIPYDGRISNFLVKSLARKFGWSMWIEGEKS